VGLVTREPLNYLTVRWKSDSFTPKKKYDCLVFHQSCAFIQGSLILARVVMSKQNYLGILILINVIGEPSSRVSNHKSMATRSIKTKNDQRSNQVGNSSTDWSVLSHKNKYSTKTTTTVN